MAATTRRKTWNSVTDSRYRKMQNRRAVIALGGLTFTLNQFREHCLKYFGEEDGVVLCRYCRVPVYLGVCAVDHAEPLGRGGSIGIENLEFPCQPCNDKKGQLTPSEFNALITFLDMLPFEAKQDVLSRLQKAVKLAAGKRWGLKKAARA